MAYGLHYKCSFSSVNQTGWVYIYEDGYGGAEEELVTRSDSVKIKYNWKGWEDPIIGLSASFSIVNDKANFFTLLPLLTAVERKYFIKIERITPSSLVMFEGFLNCENNEQKYLQKQDIRLNASSYLSKLQYVDSPTVETLENDTFINIIDDCLTQTGATDNIRVNCSLFATGDTLGNNKTLFNLNGVYKEVFWKDNIKRDSALEVVKKILTTFDCYIYWYNGYWWIERYADIWTTTKDWVEYASGTSAGYDPADTGSAVQIVETPVDFVDLVKLETSQTIGVIVGQKQIDVDIEQNFLFNLVISNMSGATTVYGVAPYPDYRKWLLWTNTMTWSLIGVAWKDIASSVHRTGWDGTYDTHRGIYTRFRMTVNDDTSLTIKFKFGCYKPSPGVWPDDYTFTFHWYLRNPVGNYYIVYNNSTEEWERVSGTETSKLQSIVVSASEFDLTNITTEVAITIDLGQPYNSDWGGDQDFVLCIGTELVERAGYGPAPRYSAWYGDVSVEATGALPDNFVSGSINTDFLNKKRITQYFSDVADLSIKNGVFRGTYLDERTDTWEEGDSLAYTLAEIKIHDKFLLYNKSRQKITGYIKDATFYKPLALFTDSNQAGLYFVLVGYTYEPQRDRMTIILSEYDNTETINLI